MIYRFNLEEIKSNHQEEGETSEGWTTIWSVREMLFSREIRAWESKKLVATE